VQIRAAIFETNSSSTHSLTVKNTDLKYETPKVGNKVVISTGEYGWDPEYLVGWSAKASYLATYAWLYGDEYHRDKFIKVMEEYLKVPVEVEVVEDSYIDHQSTEAARDMFSDIPMKDIIFSKTYKIRIDNDNH
jgi:hypothetical protein